MTDITRLIARDTIERFPAFESPEVFGMHENANITFELKESKIALETILAMQPRETSGGGTGAAAVGVKSLD